MHPDFLQGTSLDRALSRYDFFGYDVNEALHLSDGEEKLVENILRIIDGELNAHIDQFSQPIVVAQIESLLSYTTASASAGL